MRRSVFLFGILTILFAGYTNQADGQFLRKLFGGKEKTKAQKKTIKTKPVVVKQVKKREYTYPETVKKKRYRIDVFVPLYLNELVIDSKPVFKSKIPDKAVQGIDFYEGVKIASDSLNTLGYQIDVRVHDITDSNESPAILIRNKALESTDLIIGAVQSQQILPLANYAKKQHVNFISVLSPVDGGVKDNAFFTLLQPSLSTHCEWIAEKIIKEQNKKKLLVLHRTDPPGDAIAFNKLGKIEGNARALLCNVIPSKQTLSSYLDSVGNNIVVVAVLDNAYAEKLLLNLTDSFPRYEFEIYGMPSWKNSAMLKRHDFRPGITINITAPFSFDASTPLTLAIAGIYKKEIGSGKPSEMVYRGFETMFYYAGMLVSYGTVFNEKYKNSVVPPFTKFDVKLRWDNENNLLYQENTHLYHYKFIEGSSSVEP